MQQPSLSDYMDHPMHISQTTSTGSLLADETSMCSMVILILHPLCTVLSFASCLCERYCTDLRWCKLKP